MLPPPVFDTKMLANAVIALPAEETKPFALKGTSLSEVHEAVLAADPSALVKVRTASLPWAF